jgi:hypothetical protein
VFINSHLFLILTLDMASTCLLTRIYTSPFVCQDTRQFGSDETRIGFLQLKRSVSTAALIGPHRCEVRRPWWPDLPSNCSVPEHRGQWRHGNTSCVCSSTVHPLGSSRGQFRPHLNVQLKGKESLHIDVPS